jgi:hypothetical protein
LHSPDGSEKISPSLANPLSAAKLIVDQLLDIILRSRRQWNFAGRKTRPAADRQRNLEHIFGLFICH